MLRFLLFHFIVGPKHKCDAADLDAAKRLRDCFQVRRFAYLTEGKKVLVCWGCRDLWQVVKAILSLCPYYRPNLFHMHRRKHQT